MIHYISRILSLFYLTVAGANICGGASVGFHVTVGRFMATETITILSPFISHEVPILLKVPGGASLFVDLLKMRVNRRVRQTYRNTRYYIPKSASQYQAPLLAGNCAKACHCTRWFFKKQKLSKGDLPQSTAPSCALPITQGICVSRHLSRLTKPPVTQRMSR